MPRHLLLLVVLVAGSSVSCSTGQLTESKAQPQVTHDLSGVTHMADLIRSTWEAQSPPCKGLDTIPREVFEQVWAILGDTHYIDIWEGVPGYIAVAGDFNDLSLLFQFATRGVEGELASFDAPWQVHNGLSQALELVGPMAARLTRAGDRRAEALALSFLEQCADPRFWHSSQVTWRESRLKGVDIGGAGACLRSAAFLSSTSFARVVQRVESITPQLSADQVERLRDHVAGAAELYQVLQTHEPFDLGKDGTPCRPDP